MEKTYSFQKLADYVWGFATKQTLLGPGTNVAIAFSGGADSRLLLELAHCWREEGKLDSVRVFHFNHKMREASEWESEFAKRLAASLELEIIYGEREDAQLELGSSEESLRKCRHDFFKHHRRENELLLLGHHLDDSLEWSLRQLGRTSRTLSILGMPAKNKFVRRPLMCLSRDQILYACELFDLEYCHDESNDDLNYERNFLRHQVVRPLKRVAPALLKNYVARNRELARVFGVSLENNKEALKQSETLELLRWKHHPVYQLRPPKGSSLETYRETIYRALEILSTKKRGMWRDQVEKLTQCFEKKWAGPLSFSGGVCAIVTPGCVTFYHQKFSSQFESLVKEGAAEGPGWIFKIDAPIEKSHYPKIPTSHILLKWFGNRESVILMTREQLTTQSKGHAKLHF